MASPTWIISGSGGMTVRVASSTNIAWWPSREGGALCYPIVLKHNQSIGNPATVSALPAIIQFFRSHGYRFVALQLL